MQQPVRGRQWQPEGQQPLEEVEGSKEEEGGNRSRDSKTYLEREKN